MATKYTNDTADNMKDSVVSLYSSLLEKRQTERDARIEAKRIKDEEELVRKEAEKDPEEEKLSKKEKREKQFNEWQSVLVGLTGDDLEYTSNKKSKKKYKKWITDDIGTDFMNPEKPKKKKKKNYNKEFEPEINMLKASVADQNKFTIDLMKRYQTAAGPNTKDAMPLNKNLIELAGVINSSRQNSLGMLKEIGSLKKTIADLYFKQWKEDREAGNTNSGDSDDLALVGSDVMRTLFSSVGTTPTPSADVIPTSNFDNSSYQNNNITQPAQPVVGEQITHIEPMHSSESFDPNSWDGAGIDNTTAIYEAMPHHVIVEYNAASEQSRYVAINNNTGEEIPGCPVPTTPVKAMDLKKMIAKDDFDQVYQVKMI